MIKGANKSWKCGFAVLVRGWSSLPAHRCKFPPVLLLSVRLNWEPAALRSNPAVWHDAELCLCCALWVSKMGRIVSTPSRWHQVSMLGVGLDDPQRSLPTATILWFCDSMFGSTILRQSKTISEQGLKELEVCCSLPTCLGGLETRYDFSFLWNPPML